jgi:subtilase family serine protease
VEFRARFHPAVQDVNTISAWLFKHGFHINRTIPGDRIIDFSGTAGDIRETFHTELHTLDVNGEIHFANMSDPQIPAAIAPAVVGIVSLNNYRPKPQYTYGSSCQLLNKATGEPNSTCYNLVPADLETIYNFLALSSGLTGSGERIAVLEASDMYNSTGSSSDYNMFLSAFGLSSYGGTLVTYHPGGAANNCSDPGLATGVKEVTVDVEWAAAAAPGAIIEIDSCSSSGYSVQQDIDTALHNRISGLPLPLPEVISNSYGECEGNLGTVLTEAIDADYEQAGTEGISVFAASGDGGAVACDTGTQYALSGLAVNGFASSPHVVAVGGTDFSDTYNLANLTYWNSSNTSVYGSAKSYIPEIPWNNSCASPLLTDWYDLGAEP